MAQRPLSPAQLQEAVDLYELHGSHAAAGEAIGVRANSFHHRWQQAMAAGYRPGARPPVGFTLPDFPDDDIPIEDLIDLQCKRFTKRKESVDANTWFPVKIASNKPIGILWLGDPHLDDNGCNWPLLKAHAKLCRETEGLFVINLGDSTNNWGDRLARLYANQDASVKTARRFVEWLMFKSGMRFLAFLVGNHDAWGDGADVLARMAKQFGTVKIVLHDWEARFRLVFPNGTEIKIWCAHNFPGNSQWNPLHGPMKAGMMGTDAHILGCGDLHNWAVFRFENAMRGLTQTFIRARGYKFLDEYARRIGKIEQQRGASIVTVIDPSKPAGEGVYAFDDVERGVDFLNHLRASRPTRS